MQPRTKQTKLKRLQKRAVKQYNELKKIESDPAFAALKDLVSTFSQERDTSKKDKAALAIRRQLEISSALQDAARKYLAFNSTISNVSKESQVLSEVNALSGSVEPSSPNVQYKEALISSIQNINIELTKAAKQERADINKFFETNISIEILKHQESLSEELKSELSEIINKERDINRTTEMVCREIQQAITTASTNTTNNADFLKNLADNINEYLDRIEQTKESPVQLLAAAATGITNEQLRTKNTDELVNIRQNILNSLKAAETNPNIRRVIANESLNTRKLGELRNAAMTQPAAKKRKQVQPSATQIELHKIKNELDTNPLFTTLDTIIHNKSLSTALTSDTQQATQTQDDIKIDLHRIILSQPISSSNYFKIINYFNDKKIDSLLKSDATPSDKAKAKESFKLFFDLLAIQADNINLSDAATALDGLINTQPEIKALFIAEKISPASLLFNAFTEQGVTPLFIDSTAHEEAKRLLLNKISRGITLNSPQEQHESLALALITRNITDYKVITEVLNAAVKKTDAAVIADFARNEHAPMEQVINAVETTCEHKGISEQDKSMLIATMNNIIAAQSQQVLQERSDLPDTDTVKSEARALFAQTHQDTGSSLKVIHAYSKSNLLRSITVRQKLTQMPDADKSHLEQLRTLTDTQAALIYAKNYSQNASIAELGALLSNPNLPLDMKIKEIIAPLKTDHFELMKLAVTAIEDRIKATQAKIAALSGTTSDPLIAKYSTLLNEAESRINKLRTNFNAPSAKKMAEVRKALKSLGRSPSSLDQLAAIEKFADHLSSHPVVETPNAEKQSLRSALQTMPDMNDYLQIGKKEGGANQPGKFGGVYIKPYRVKDTEKTQIQRILFKQDTHGHDIQHAKNMTEVMAGRIMNAVIGDAAASVFFATAPTSDGQPVKIPDESGENVYVGSIFYDDYKDLFAELGFSQRPYDIGNWNKKQFIDGFCHTDPLTGKQICKFENFEAVTAASALTGDFDVHLGNYGVITTADGSKKLVKIDHGAGLERLEDDIHIHSHTRHPLGMGPTNHIREYPRDLKITLAMANELERQSSPESQAKIAAAINTTMKEISQHYGLQPILQFAKHIGMKINPEDKRAQNKILLVDDMRTFLTHKMAARQASQKELAVEIKLSLAIKKDKGKFHFDASEVDIKKLMLENPLYFLKGNYHFRGKDQRSTFGPIKTKILTQGPLNDMVFSELKQNLDAMLRNAEQKQNPKVFEHLLDNAKLLKSLTPEQRTDIQTRYQSILTSMSRELTQISRELFTNMSPDELKNTSMSDAQPESHKKIAYAFENLTERVKQDVLSEKDLGQRALVAERWIAIMTNSMKQNDLHTVMSIYSGLRSKSVRELSDTFANLSPNANTAWTKICDLFEENGVRSTAKMRELMKNKLDANEPCIPIFSDVKIVAANLADQAKNAKSPHAEQLIADMNALHEKLQSHQSKQNNAPRREENKLFKLTDFSQKPGAPDDLYDQVVSRGLEARDKQGKKKPAPQSTYRREFAVTASSLKTVGAEPAAISHDTTIIKREHFAEQEKAGQHKWTPAAKPAIEVESSAAPSVAPSTLPPPPKAWTRASKPSTLTVIDEVIKILASATESLEKLNKALDTYNQQLESTSSKPAPQHANTEPDQQHAWRPGTRPSH